MKFITAITLAASVASVNAFSGIAATRKSIGALTKDNFDATLKEVEPFLLNDAGTTFYAKSMKRIAVQAAALGAEVPADFAKDAKATKKRRERQNAYVQAKIAEAADAVEEEPAEEAEAEEEVAE